jgi:hypothetical protein
MDFVKEIERLQREQSLKLGLKDAHAPGAVLRPSAPEPAPTPAKGAGTGRARLLASKPVPAGAAPGASSARTAAAVVAGVALLVPVAILVGFALSGLEDAWDGEYLYPVDALFVVGPLVLAVAVLQARRQIVAGLREGQPSARGPRVPWLLPTLVALFIAAVALTAVFPRGVPLGRWLGG